MDESNEISLSELLRQQMESWSLVKTNFGALDKVRTKDFEMGGLRISVQFNPARIVSSAAKVDAESIKNRKCFLCPANLPDEQIRLPFHKDYLVLVNPYPIFREHFTVPALRHEPQSILERIGDFVDLARRYDGYTIIYNGPCCGASAPDHAHFQIVTYGQMPLDTDVLSKGKPINIEGFPGGKVNVLTDYLRNGFVLKSESREESIGLFKKIYSVLPALEDETTESPINLFGYYLSGEWVLVVIPRRRHRPWQYAAVGKERFVSSPGAADIGGLFVTVREEDFNKIDAKLLEDIYRQVCFNDREIEDMAAGLS